MFDDSLTPDLNGTACAATDCIEVADVVHTVTVWVHDDVGIGAP